MESLSKMLDEYTNMSFTERLVEIRKNCDLLVSHTKKDSPKEYNYYLNKCKRDLEFLQKSKNIMSFITEENNKITNLINSFATFIANRENSENETYDILSKDELTKAALYNPGETFESNCFLRGKMTREALYNPGETFDSECFLKNKCTREALYNPGKTFESNCFLRGKMTREALYNPRETFDSERFSKDEWTRAALYNPRETVESNRFLRGKLTREALYNPGETFDSECFLKNKCTREALYNPGETFDSECFLKNKCTREALYNPGETFDSECFLKNKCTTEALYNPEETFDSECFLKNKCTTEALYNPEETFDSKCFLKGIWTKNGNDNSSKPINDELVTKKISLSMKNNSISQIESTLNNYYISIPLLKSLVPIIVSLGTIEILDLFFNNKNVNIIEIIDDLFYCALQNFKAELVKQIVSSKIFKHRNLLDATIIEIFNKHDFIIDPLYDHKKPILYTNNSLIYIKWFLDSKKFYLTKNYLQDIKKILLPKNFQIVKLIIESDHFLSKLYESADTKKEIMDNNKDLFDYLENNKYSWVNLFTHYPFPSINSTIEYLSKKGIAVLSLQKESVHPIVLTNSSKGDNIIFGKNTKLQIAINFLRSKKIKCVTISHSKLDSDKVRYVIAYY